MIKIRSFLTLISFCALSLYLVSDAHAVRHDKYCDNVETTADIQSCIHEHNEKAKESLSEVYQSLLNQTDNEAKTDIIQAQKEWIEYRNTQCEYEAKLAENDALKRVYQQSCLTALTEMRTSYIATLKLREEGGMPWELGNQPRWVNILTNAYPKVYWRYGEWISTDLDCDGEKEDIMPGLEIVQNKATQKDDTNLVIAVAENPVAGKPKAAVYRVPVLNTHLEEKTATTAGEPSKSAEDKTGLAAVHLCSGNVNFALFKQGQISPNTNQGQQCATSLQISDSVCRPLQLKKEGEAYQIDFFNPSADEKADTSIESSEKIKADPS